MSTSTSAAPLTLLNDAITHAAARDADHPAVRMQGTDLSYADLERRSNSVAHLLHDRGVRRGDRVGLFAHKSVESLVALHGIMRAGAAYVPINPDAPAAYAGQIVADCEINHLIVGPTTQVTASALAREFGLAWLIGVTDNPDDAVQTVTWDEVWTYPEVPIPGLQIDGDDLAYVVFTSGSTGRPKGIMHSHRTGLAYAEVAAATFGFRTDDRITNHAPLNFDLSTLELFAGAVAGGTVVIVPEGHARLPASFSQLLQDEMVTVINAVPFALVQLLHRGALDDRDLSAVRWVLFGGEVFPTRDLRALMSRLPLARFGNVYGPAETNGCTYYVVPELPPESTDPIPIGALYDGMEAIVVDTEDREVARGQTGELLVNSPTRMLGYWRQPELTQRSTYLRDRGDGGVDVFHRTGDLVHEGDAGLFHLTGRRDRLIKTRGHRVELDEVETVLQSHEAVEQAVVYAVPDGDGSQRIEASVILRPEAEDSRTAPTGTDLKRHAQRLLPRYAVPGTIEVTESVPRTSTGKPDRVALVSRAQYRSDQAR